MTQHEKISVELRKRLDAMRPGERFPSEPELCREFGVARMTVNKVVTELVRDGRLVRQRGRGSFVAEAPRERKVINYLLPCAGYLTDSNALHIRKIAFGVAEEAQRRNMGMELIPVSPDNNRDHIDFSTLEHLNDKSLVVIPSGWFYAVFPFLAERKCQVVLIDRRMRSRHPNCEYAEQFKILDYDLQEAVEQAVRRLYQKGCRRIALRTSHRKDRPIHYLAYLGEIRRLNLPEITLFQATYFLHITEEEQMQLKKFRCDALIFDAFERGGLAGPDMASVVGIPSGIAYEVIRFHPDDNALLKNPPASSIDARELGIAAVKMLLDPDKPARQTMKAEFFPEKMNTNHMSVVNFE